MRGRPRIDHRTWGAALAALLLAPTGVAAATGALPADAVLLDADSLSTALTLAASVAGLALRAPRARGPARGRRLAAVPGPDPGLADPGRLPQYLAAAGVVIVALDARGRVEFVGGRACRVLGYGPDELIGRDWCRTCVPPERRGMVRNTLRRLLQGRPTGTGPLEHEVVTRAGERRTVRWFNTLVWDDAGGVAGIVKSGVDVTDQRRAEQALRERNREWATLVANLPGVVYRCALDDGFSPTFVSERVREIAGCAPDDLLSGRVRYLDLIHPDDLERVAAEARRALQARRPFRVLYRLCPPDGTVRWIWDQGAGIPGPDGEPRWVEGFLTDVTEQRRAEQSARELEIRLAHAERLTTMGEMASGLAHEMGQPLFAIVNTARACLRRLERGDDPAKLADDLREVAGQADRARAIVRGMRDFARKGSGVPVLADVNALVADALRLARAEARRHGARLRFQAGRSLPSVAVNPVQIAQVVVNLVRNGIEAMAEAGARPEVLVATATGGEGGVAVTVSDRGPGIAPDTAERLFEPFHTTKGHGMGLGLAICRGLVEAHGGRIEAGNAPEGGAWVRFTLPPAAQRPTDA
jgi:two-component system sensor kinase FixL